MFGLVNSGGERISCHNFSPLLFKNFFVIKKIVFAIILILIIVYYNMTEILLLNLIINDDIN